MFFGSYSDMKLRITNNDIFIFMRDLLTPNWPQGEVFPKSLDEFLERMYDTVFRLVEIMSRKCYHQPHRRDMD